MSSISITYGRQAAPEQWITTSYTVRRPGCTAWLQGITTFAEAQRERRAADAHALAVQLRDSTAGQQVAVAEIVQRFWRHADLPAREALAKAGARYAVG